MLPCVSGTCAGGTGDISHWRLGGTSRGAAPTAPGNKWDRVSDPDATVTLLPASPIRRMSRIVNLSKVRACARVSFKVNRQERRVARR